MPPAPGSWAFGSDAPARVGERLDRRRVTFDPDPGDVGTAERPQEEFTDGAVDADGVSALGDRSGLAVRTDQGHLDRYLPEEEPGTAQSLPEAVFGGGGQIAGLPVGLGPADVL